jgi:hypothetical protein
MMEFCEDCQCEMETCVHLEHRKWLKEKRAAGWAAFQRKHEPTYYGSDWCDVHQRRLTDCRCFMKPRKSKSTLFVRPKRQTLKEWCDEGQRDYDAWRHICDTENMDEL